MGATEGVSLDQYYHRVTYIRLLNIMGKYDESLHLLARLSDIAEETGATVSSSIEKVESSPIILPDMLIPWVTQIS